MSPDQSKGTHRADARKDVNSLIAGMKLPESSA